MAFFACQFGARRVYAIETGDIIEVARFLARANGFADRIEFIQASSDQVSLPEPAQVMVSDIRGTLPFFHDALPALLDARRRFLAPGGILIPCRDILWGAVVTAPRKYRILTGPWESRPYGLNLEAGRLLAVHHPVKHRPRPEHLLTEARCWVRLNYEDLDSPDAEGPLAWEVQRDGVGHGFVVWFDTELIPGLGFSNAPGVKETLYGRLFFPWPEPVTLAAGDRVRVTLGAHLVGNSYIWRWDTQVLAPEGSGAAKADFRQSNLYGVPLSPLSLHRQAADFVPDLGKDGRVARFILNRHDGTLALGEIADLLIKEFPGHFATRVEALTRVGELSAAYSIPPSLKKFWRKV